MKQEKHRIADTQKLAKKMMHVVTEAAALSEYLKLKINFRK